MKHYKVHINGKSYEVAIEELGDTPRHSSSQQVAVTPAPAGPAPSSAASPPATSGGQQRADNDRVTAPMPGTILRVAVATGDSVKHGDTLIILEAMKMENEILAPRDGIIKQINVAQGASVNAGDPLLSIAP
jgi:glutaconyl-CoA/methylmalonyl-CoA decarboxylase subunit gamma